MIVEGGMHGPSTKVWKGRVLPAQTCPLSMFCTLLPFYGTCRTFFKLFIVISFDIRRSQLKCVELHVEVLTGIKPALSCGDKAEG